MCDARALKKSKLDAEQLMDGLERMLASHPPAANPLTAHPLAPHPRVHPPIQNINRHIHQNHKR